MGVSRWSEESNRAEVILRGLSVGIWAVVDVCCTNPFKHIIVPGMGISEPM